MSVASSLAKLYTSIFPTQGNGDPVWSHQAATQSSAQPDTPTRSWDTTRVLIHVCTTVRDLIKEAVSMSHNLTLFMLDLASAAQQQTPAAESQHYKGGRPDLEVNQMCPTCSTSYFMPLSFPIGPHRHCCQIPEALLGQPGGCTSQQRLEQGRGAVSAPASCSRALKQCQVMPLTQPQV